MLEFYVSKLSALIIEIILMKKLYTTIQLFVKKLNMIYYVSLSL